VYERLQARRSDAEASKHRDSGESAPADAETFRERGYSAAYGATSGQGPYSGRPTRGRYSDQPVRGAPQPTTYDSDIEGFRERAY
jgi:hypothetical protein